MSCLANTLLVENMHEFVEVYVDMDSPVRDNVAEETFVALSNSTSSASPNVSQQQLLESDHEYQTNIESDYMDLA